MNKIAKTMSDGQFIAGIQAGGRQRSQFERTLYDQYTYLISHARKRHQLEFDECASAYSDTILSVINHLENGLFDRRSSLKTYLHRIFSNECIDYLRHKRNIRNRVHQALALDDMLLVLPDPARSVVERLSAQYDVYELQQQLGKFSAKNRALVLAWGEGYSDEEIAKQFGYRSSAVAKTTRLRCLRQLREQLARTPQSLS